MIKKEENLNNSFDVIVGNPPYDGNTHLKIINAVLSLLKEDGIASFIHPARWYQDPLAEYKKGSDKVKFKNIVDRLNDVNVMRCLDANKRFGIINDGDLMISTIKSQPVNKFVSLYNDMSTEVINVILQYSKEHNLEQVEDIKQLDGWRVEIKDIIPQGRPDDKSNRLIVQDLFHGTKKVVFKDGYDEETGLFWTLTRNKNQFTKSEGTPFAHSIKFNTEEDANNFVKSCRCNFYWNIMYLLKLDMHTPLKFLPWMEDYSHPWTDEDYCKFFGDLGMSKECQEWMCRTVDDYRIKDFIDYEKFDDVEKD